MSVDKNYYVIGGYDLTEFRADKYSDWKWTEQGEEYTCYQANGKIQLFDDPMSGHYLYLGYIFASGDEYDFDTARFSISDVEKHHKDVETELLKLVEVGIIRKDALMHLQFNLIAFEECR